LRPRRALIFTTPTMDNIVEWLVRHGRVLDGNISFGGTMANTDKDRNITCWKASGTTPGAANTDFTITHGLNRVPKTILGQDTNNGGLLYRSPATAWTKTAITLRCTTATAAYNIIFD
jgi:hypothetical protein